MFVFTHTMTRSAEMRTLIIVILLAFWCYLAEGAWQRGDHQRAGVYLIVGLALTAYRFGVGRK